jgi:hypothetical protein
MQYKTQPSGELTELLGYVYRKPQSGWALNFAEAFEPTNDYFLRMFILSISEDNPIIDQFRSSA